MRIRSPFFVLVLAVLVSGCSGASGAAGRDEEAVRQAYQGYRAAMSKGDLAVLKTMVTHDRVQELGAPDAVEKMQMASALYPEGAQIAGVRVSGSEATLRLTGRMQEGSAAGTVRLVKEAGAWKVSTEDWQIQISIGAEGSPAAAQLPPDVVRPSDFGTLHGRWQGGDWTFTFAGDYAVSGEHVSRMYYRGQAAIFWELGSGPGGLRVPPGWSVLDVQVTDASEPRHIGQVSLGTFSRQGDELKYCGSEPGAHVRTQSFEAPPSGVRCLTLVRAGDGDVASGSSGQPDRQFASSASAGASTR
jgi:hypothetical protein